MAITLPGICGPRGGSNCKVAHSSNYPNKVGVYPSQFLPSAFTLYRAVFASQFPLQTQDPTIGNLGFLGAGTLSIGQAFVPILPLVHTFQSHHTVIFAKTANRINSSHVLTQEEIDTGIIDVGEYVFEVVAVTDVQEEIEQRLTEAELADLEKTGESEADFAFRKLFKQGINVLNNRLIGIVSNRAGIEYRMDNGTRKSLNITSQAGVGGLELPSYRDGTSKELSVDLTKITERRPLQEGEPIPPAGSLQAEAREPRAGDTVFLTYVAIKEHYIRQKIQISWQTIDPGTVNLGAPCISLPLGFSVVHYRFFEWDLEPEPGETTPKRLAGWRAVESFEADVNFVTVVEKSGGNLLLADFPAGRQFGRSVISTDFLPGSVTESELNSFLSDRNTFPIYDIALTEDTQSVAFHINSGVDGNRLDYVNSEWFGRKNFSKYTDKFKAFRHVFFNVHPQALRKRDIDKWGIEKTLAQEIEKDINNAKPTLFPFMDDPDINNPTNTVFGVNKFLDASNCKFLPIQPVTSYGGNFEAICGSLGSFPTNPTDGINTYHSFESNFITERFDTDTHILVELNFAVGAGPLGPNLITIEGTPQSRGSVSTITDPSKTYSFVGHINDDGFLVYNTFQLGYVNEALRKLSYRPDKVVDPNAPIVVNNFEKLLGATGMIGDIPGIQPGKTIALSSFAEFSSFVYNTTDDSKIRRRYSNITTDQIEEIIFTHDEKLSVSLNNTYHGSLLIEFDLPENDKDDLVILIAKVGGSVTGIVDSLSIRRDVGSGSKGVLRVNFHWLRADVLELVGSRIQDMKINYIEVLSIKSDKINDFLKDGNSHTSSINQLTDRSLFIGSDNMVSISEDENSNLYIFFGDSDGGISVAVSHNFGSSWYYQYGIVEKIGADNSFNPFVITQFEQNTCYLFFQFQRKILCKKITFELFDANDANLIERFTTDILELGDPNSEKNSIYSDKGILLRRRTLSYVVAGDLTDNVFREVAGKVHNEFEYKPLEDRIINGKLQEVRKNSVVIGPKTAFTHRDIVSPFFSAYRKDNGELKFWFLGQTQASGGVESGITLQCHFSEDDGQNWYDLWEFIENKFNRIRHDSVKKTQFIDRSADGNVIPTNFEADDPQQSNQDAEFGINIHWSRLKRHKISTGNGNINDESLILEVSAPYVFYQSSGQVFLFYIYENCLLCKIFNDSIFRNASDMGGMSEVKNTIERNTRAYFIDGFLKNNNNLQEEIHGFFNEEKNEIMAEGNIIFRYPFAVNSFTDDRTVPEQRVCAHELQTGLVRVFYKHTKSSNLKSALWTGSEFWAEDFMKTSADIFKLPDHSDAVRVYGGFGDTGYGAVKNA